VLVRPPFRSTAVEPVPAVPNVRVPADFEQPGASISTERRGPRLDSLTGLRFVAALSVLLLHVTASRVNHLPLVDLGAFAGRLAELGYLGVTFFFALSGFVLTWSASGTRLSARTFYRRRFARVYPLHLVTALVAGIGGLVFGLTASPGACVAVLLLVQSWVPDVHWYFALNGVSWSLSCEAFFYAVTPVVLVVAARRSLRAAWAGVAVLGAVVLAVSLLAVSIGPSWDQRVWVSPWYSVVSFLAGVALAKTLKSDVVAWPSLRVAGCALAGALGVVVLASWRDVWPRSIATMVVLPAIVLVLGAAARTDLAGRGSWLAHRRVVLLGEWSFALYLVHPLLLHAIQRGWTPPVLSGGAAVVELLAFVTTAIAAAAGAYHLVERPAERWLRGGPRAERPAADPVR
jgi:peptidoglycan/LPS O-acetylase OafA/YrhL